MAQLKDLIVNGPSRFIGDVYATTFTGDLNGNANTATSATTAAALTGKTLVTASALTTSNWPTYGDNHIPTMSFMAHWNGAYSGTSSNLTYCAQGAIIGSNNIGNQSVKYATTSGSCNGNAATAGSATNADKLDGYHASSFSLTSHTHSYIVTQGDNRSVATTPNDYKNKITFAGLKTNTTIGRPSTSPYSYVVGLRGWSDTSGGKAHELAFSDNGIFHRIGATDTWEAWSMMLTTSNYNSYAPSLTGTGASGTWGINITGNAATATNANYAASAGSAPASDVKAWAKADTKPSYNGSEVKLSNYSKASSYSEIAASDTVNQAIGKLEGAISGLETLLASI